jgi:hypothetical protein
VPRASGASSLARLSTDGPQGRGYSWNYPRGAGKLVNWTSPSTERGGPFPGGNRLLSDAL